MKLIDIRAEVDDGKPNLQPPSMIDGFAVHRIWYDDTPLSTFLHPIDIAKRFVHDPEVAKYTGGELPYTFLVDAEGTWWQCLRISDVGKHARRWSWPYVGVGLIGDFRHQPPAAAQRTSLIEGLAELLPAFDIHPYAKPRLRDGRSAWALAGHDELAGGSADPNKRCPGKYLNMETVRENVAHQIPRRALAAIQQLGVAV